MPPRKNELPGYLALEGNIGAGKTTLAKKLAADFGHRLVLEQFTDNPFLPFFYEDPERYAFSVELFFMTERHKQLQRDLTQRQLFQEKLIADYYFLKTLLFAKNNLSGEEYRLFRRLFRILNNQFPKPELLFYLHRPVEVLLEQIARRGRSFESEISADYLSGIQKTYFEYFRSERTFPIIILEMDDADFTLNQNVYQSIIGVLQQPYPNGLTTLQIAKWLQPNP